VPEIKMLLFLRGGFERKEEGEVTIPQLEDANLLLYQPRRGLLPGTL
jgi:hypothetical protein